LTCAAVHRPFGNARVSSAGAVPHHWNEQQHLRGQSTFNETARHSIVGADSCAPGDSSVDDNTGLMFKTTTLLFGVAAALTSIVANGASIGKVVDAQKRREFADSALVWVSSPEVELFSAPSIRSKIVAKYQFTSRLLIDMTGISGRPAGWIPIRYSYQHPIGWVKEENVVSGRNARKVVDCWPVKSFDFIMGDESTAYTFERTGKGRFRSAFDEGNPNRVLSGRLQVYLEKNMLFLINDKKNLVQHEVGVFNEGPLAVLFYDEPAYAVKYRSDSEMAGCAGVLYKEVK
jgi:hypothetical protein